MTYNTHMNMTYNTHLNMTYNTHMNMTYNTHMNTPWSLDHDFSFKRNTNKKLTCIHIHTEYTHN